MNNPTLPRHIRIESWRPGCVFSSEIRDNKLTGQIVVSESNGVMTFGNGRTALRVRTPSGVFARKAQVVEQCPKDGTCSSRVSGVWYGNAEILDYVNRQRAWLPYSGLFRIVPGIGLLPGEGPDEQVEFGWYREKFGDE
jgi:hypothetical protein